MSLSVREVVLRRPVVTALACAILQFLLTVAILKAGSSALPPSAFGKVKLVAFASTVLFPLLLAQGLGLWRAAGLRPTDTRFSWVFIAALVLTTTPFLVFGLHAPQQGGGVVGNLVIQLFNAFGEELLFRGVIFALLLGLPQGRAIVLNGLLFGAMHLIHGTMDTDWRVAAWTAAVTAVGGMMFTAVRFTTGSLWPVVALHMLLNLSKIFSNAPQIGHSWAAMAERVSDVGALAVVAWVIARGVGLRQQQERRAASSALSP